MKCNDLKTIKVFFICASFVTAIVPSAFTQCLGLKFDAGSTSIYTSTDIPALDTRINQEANLIWSVFHVKPKLLIFDDGISPNAFAQPYNEAMGTDGAVLLGKQLLTSELWNMDKGDYAVAGIMAHEFAHILQKKKDCGLKGKNRELHADFMAGYYLGVKSYALPTNIRMFAKSLFEKGDYEFWSPLHHGTPIERVDAMVKGFEACDQSLSEAFKGGIEFIEDSDSSATTSFQQAVKQTLKYGTEHFSEKRGDILTEDDGFKTYKYLGSFPKATELILEKSDISKYPSLTMVLFRGDSEKCSELYNDYVKQLKECLPNYEVNESEKDNRSETNFRISWSRSWIIIKHFNGKESDSIHLEVMPADY